MALNIYIHSRPPSKQPVTVNIFLNGHENGEAAAATQSAIRLPSGPHPPDPTANHHAQAISTDLTLSPGTKSDFNTATNTPGGFGSRLRSYMNYANGRQRHNRASWLSLSRRLLGGLFLKAQDVGPTGSCCSACRDKKFHKAARQNINANGHITPCHLELATENFGLGLEKRSCRLTHHHDQPRIRGEDNDYPNNAAAVFPVRQPYSACNDPLVLRYRSIELIVRKLNGREDSFCATMDTGADLSVMTVKTAKTLGYLPSEQDSGTVLKGIGQHPMRSLGAVRVPFRLHCNREEHWADFHLVHDLAGHQALLGVGLIMKLDHLRLPPCKGCGSAVVDSASP